MIIKTISLLMLSALSMCVTGQLKLHDKELKYYNVMIAADDSGNILELSSLDGIRVCGDTIKAVKQFLKQFSQTGSGLLIPRTAKVTPGQPKQSEKKYLHLTPLNGTLGKRSENGIFTTAPIINNSDTNQVLMLVSDTSQISNQPGTSFTISGYQVTKPYRNGANEYTLETKEEPIYLGQNKLRLPPNLIVWLVRNKLASFITDWVH